MKRNNLLVLLPFIILLWGLYTVPLRSTGPRFTHIPGDMGDARFNNFVLEHGYRYVRGQEPAFWNAPVFYPELNTIAFSDSHIGNLPVYSAFRFIGLDRESAFQAWIVVCFLLNFLLCFYVLRKLGFGWIASSGGAYVFTFGLPVIAQLSHLQLMPRFFVPLVFFRLWSYLEKPDSRHLLYAGIFLAIQFYISIYTGWFLVLSGSVFYIAGRIVTGRAAEIPAGRGALRWAGACALAAVLLIPLILPYVGVAGEKGARSWWEIWILMPRSSSLLFPAGGTLLWRGLESGKSFYHATEHRIFPGAVSYAGLAAAILVFLFKKKKSRGDRLAFIAALSVVFVIVAVSRMSVRGVNIYRALTLLPGVGALRAVTRIMLVLLFPFAILVSFLFKQAGFVKQRALRAALAPLLLIAVLADHSLHPPVPDFSRPRNSYSKHRARARSESVKKDIFALAETPKVFAYMPADARSPFWEVHLDAMLAAQDAGIPTISGYSGVFPAYYDISMNFADLWALDRWIAHSNRKWEGRERVYPQLPGDDLFEGLVIIGGPRGERSDPGFMEAPLPEDEFRAGIFPEKDFISGIPRGTSRFAVDVRNESSINWGSIGKPDGTYEFTLRWRWLSEEGEPLTGFDSIKNIRYDIGPGESREFNVAVRLPEERGEYLLEFDLFQEQVSRFGDMGGETAIVEVEIR